MSQLLVRMLPCRSHQRSADRIDVGPTVSLRMMLPQFGQPGWVIESTGSYSVQSVNLDLWHVLRM